MGHSLSRTNLTIKDLFIKDGGETANYILVSDEKGMANWKKPSNYIADKPNDHYIGELFGGGVVVAVWQENGIEKCLIAGPENISTVRTQLVQYRAGFSLIRTAAQNFIDYGFQWGLVDAGTPGTGGFDGTTSLQTIGASYSSFGASNSNIIGNYTHPTAPLPYFAAERCLDYYNPDLGTGIWDDWFLPSIYELNHLVNNAAIFNKVLESFASNSGRPIKDVVNNQAGISFFDETSYINTTSFTQTDINLIEFGGTKYTTNTTSVWGGNVFTQTTTSNDYNPPASYYGDGSFYLSSTEVSNDSRYSAWGVLLNPSSNFSENLLNPIELYKGLTGSIRPFRIADDTQTTFSFDWDYAVITYKFSGERDLDTRTKMITPLEADSEIGFGSYFNDNSNTDGQGWTPDFPTHARSSTYSILWHGGDNRGFGYETVLVNLNAFKYYYPGQSEIIIDARAHWYTSNWRPVWAGDQARLDATEPVILGVDLYKGGNPIKNPNDGYQWVNPTAGASYSLSSYGKKINVSYGSGFNSMRVARFKYNLVGKFGYLIID